MTTPQSAIIDESPENTEASNQAIGRTAMRKATLRRLLLRDTFPLELDLHKLDCLSSHRSLEYYDFLIEQAEELKKKPKIRPPMLNGKDLIELGMEPGDQQKYVRVRGVHPRVGV